MELYHRLPQIEAALVGVSLSLIGIGHWLDRGTAADLRKDWARQKRTIEELIRDGGEDRQVHVYLTRLVQN